jgi:hypothetical protein
MDLKEIEWKYVDRIKPDGVSCEDDDESLYVT